MIYKNAAVLCGDSGFKNIQIAVKDGRFVSPDTVSGDDVTDLSGMMIVPGLIDIHTHGAMGKGANGADSDTIPTMARYLLSNGVTSFAPTLPTDTEDAMLSFADLVRDYIDGGEEYSRIAGIHYEGPYIAESHRGCMPREFIKAPDATFARRLQEYTGGLMKLICVAPECDGAMEFIKDVSKYCTVSIGHTGCDYDTAMEAIRHGASHLTHTFNAMPPLHHRQPGVLGAAFDSDIMCECISDGIHLHPSTVRTLYKIVGKERLVLISDSIRAAGLSDGVYTEVHQKITVKDGVARLDNGTIAGSSVNLLQCVQRAISFGIPPEDAFRCASLNPAKVMKLDNELGSIEIGKLADFLVLDKNYKLCRVYKNGIELYKSSKEL